MEKKSIRNQNVIERLWYIEWLLMFKGWLSRNELTEKFSIQEAAATRDIRKYRDMAEKNLHLNHSVKRYEINLDTFSPEYDVHIETALSRLRNKQEAIAMGYEDAGIEAIPRLQHPKINVLAAISRAILNKRSVTINYQSLKNGHSVKEIAPHSMFDSGIKTYTRCYDFEKEKFIDLALNRIGDIEAENNQAPDNALREEDNEWNTFITLELEAHPMDKKIANKKTIENDYEMIDGIKKIEVRTALAQYWLQRWNVDCSKDSHMNDSLYQLHLRNSEILDNVNGFFPGKITKNKK